MLTDKVTFFSSVGLVDLRNANRGWIGDLNVERMISNGFVLMRDLDSICANYFRFVFDTIDPVFRPGNLIADDASSRTFDRMQPVSYIF